VMSKTGRYKIFPILGAVSLAVGMGLLSTMDTSTSSAVTTAYMVLVGIGTGFSLQMANTIAQNSVELRDMGAASAATSLFRTLGGSLGVAVFGSLFTRATEGQTGSSQGYLQAVAHGSQQIFLVGALCAAAALLAAVFIKEVPLRKPPTANQNQTTAKVPDSAAS